MTCHVSLLRHTYEIPTRLLKEYIEDFVPLLVHIINCSLSSGVFPKEWKSALVVPLLKKSGLDTIHKNYRPVSNLQYISKLTERAVVNRICKHYDHGFPLPVSQSAYRAKHSTETALAKVQSDILTNMDQQKITQLVMIDLSAAFDTVDHDLLLTIMEDLFGVSGLALRWFSSYLHQRSQHIAIEGTLSNQFSLAHGVPQGSCLGPVLFSQYSSPVFQVVEQHDQECHAYADDHQIYKGFYPGLVVSEVQNMERCISCIRDWMQGMQLKMNDSKTEYMLIGTSKQLSKCFRLPFRLPLVKVSLHPLTVFVTWVHTLINICQWNNMS